MELYKAVLASGFATCVPRAENGHGLALAGWLQCCRVPLGSDAAMLGNAAGPQLAASRSWACLAQVMILVQPLSALGPLPSACQGRNVCFTVVL